MKMLPVWVVVVLVCLFASVSLSAGATPDPDIEPELMPIRPALVKADLRTPGTYTSGKWKYILLVNCAGTRSEGCFGSLFYENKPVPTPTRVNDHYQSPWGKIYWRGTKRHGFGTQGWHSRANKKKLMGRLLPIPGSPAPRQVKLTDEQIVKLKVLIKDLGAADFQKREAAEAAIRKMGSGALPHVKKHLKDKDAEVAERTARIAKHLENLMPPKPSKVAVTLAMDKKKYKVGERMRLTLTFTNKGEKPVRLPGYYCWLNAPSYILTGPDGKQIVCVMAVGKGGGKPRLEHTLLAPGVLKQLTTDGRFTKRKPFATLSLASTRNYFPLPSLGKYTLKFRITGKTVIGQAQPLGPMSMLAKAKAKAKVKVKAGRLLPAKLPDPPANNKLLVGTIESNTVTFEVVK